MDFSLVKDFYLRAVVVKFNVKFLGFVDLHPGQLTLIDLKKISVQRFLGIQI